MIDENGMLIGLLALVFGALAAIAALSNRGSLPPNGFRQNYRKEDTTAVSSFLYIKTGTKTWCLVRLQHPQP